MKNAREREAKMREREARLEREEEARATWEPRWRELHEQQQANWQRQVDTLERDAARRAELFEQSNRIAQQHADALKVIADALTKLFVELGKSPH